jgi:hypothetical protein
MANEVVVAPSGGAEVGDPVGEMSPLLHLAVREKVPVESLEKLVALHNQEQDRRAAREFQAAMSKFSATCPPIVRRTENSQFQVTRDGRRESRRYASLEDIAHTVRGPLGECGLSFRWGDMKLDGELLALECVVAHVGGHSVTSRVSLPYKSQAGASEQQKMGSAMTYAQRYSLVQALGLTTCDEDEDGGDPTTIDDEQERTLEEWIVSSGADRARFIQGYLKVEKLSDLRASDYAMALNALKAKAAGK